MIAALYTAPEGVAIVASRSRKLRRCMVRVQASALRRAKGGSHRLASERWLLLTRLHLTRNALLRAWRLL
jgi:hypothetical protein